MNRVLYIIANATIMLGILLPDWLEDMMKLYYFLAFVIITLSINVVFRIKWISDIIIERALRILIERALRDPDIQKVMAWKFEAMREKAKMKNVKGRR